VRWKTIPETRTSDRKYTIAITGSPNNVETVRDTRYMSMNHDYETGFSDSVNKNCVKRPLAEY